MNIHDINQVSNPFLFLEVCHMAVKVNLKWLRSPPPFWFCRLWQSLHPI